MDSLDSLAPIRARALGMLRPPPRLQLSKWIEGEMRLPAGVSSSPGRVRLWPYQRGIADAISDPLIERVTLVKPVRVGFTTLLTGAVASYVANEPSPVLVVLPTDADCRNYVVSDFEPIAEATPAIAALLAPENDESGRSILTSRRFPGGSLKVVAAKSPRNLRSHNVRILLMDEVDAMEPTAEGSPIDLAIGRTRSFANRKIIIGSTPVNEETSNVLRSYATSDRRIYEVPCPECGAFTEILWSHIQWESGEPATAAFLCPHCDALIDERHKTAMVAAGDWRATAPDVIGHAGFRMNALISTLPNMSWSKLAAEFIAAKEHPDKLQAFVNTVLGQGWREAAEETDPADLASRAEDFGLDAMPADVLVMTAGVDVQHDRLETSIIGHSRDAAFVLDHVVIWGSPGDDSTWEELDDLLKSTWSHPNGGTLRLDAVAVDSGDGAWTSRIYDFTRPRFARKVLAIKGVSGVRPPFSRSSAKGTPMFLIGVDGLKSQILQRLARGKTIRFSNRLEPNYYDQVASERAVVRYSRGQPVRTFERVPGRRAECLDCLVYGLAVRHAVTVHPDRREEELSTPAAPVARKAVVRSAWMDR